MKINHSEAKAHVAQSHSVAYVAPGERSRRLDKKSAFPDEKTEGDYFLLVDERGNLTHSAMELAIREGGSVMHHGEVIDKLADLPEESALVKGNQAAEEQYKKSLLARRAALDSELAALTQSSPSVQGEKHPAAESHPETEHEGHETHKGAQTAGEHDAPRSQPAQGKAQVGKKG